MTLTGNDRGRILSVFEVMSLRTNLFEESEYLILEASQHADFVTSPPDKLINDYTKNSELLSCWEHVLKEERTSIVTYDIDFFSRSESMNKNIVNSLFSPAFGLLTSSISSAHPFYHVL